MDWFCEVRQLLERTSSLSALDPRFHRAYKLFHHRRRLLSHKQARKGYMLQDSGTGNMVRMDGLTRPLKTVFYPYQQSASTGGAKTGGSARGNLVDREIAALVNNGVVPATPSKYTTQVLTYLKKHGLQPFAAQFLVYDERLNIATELDLLCIDTNVAEVDNVVNAQVKTGFDLNYETAKEKFCSPFVKDSRLTHIYASHKNTHQLQTLVEHMIVQINYDSLLRESVVLVFSEEVNSMYRIGHEIMGVRADIYQNLFQRRQVNDTELEVAGLRAGAAAKRANKLFT